ncbi:MAG: DUF2508 family protein [Clostridia bacterium]|nr:DUF2508 family protein [Clostridia bacterium]
MVIDLFADKNAVQKEDKMITNETKRVINEMKKTRMLFNEVTDPYEIESLIYRMKELELHYSFLIKEAKLGKVASIDYLGGVII